MSGISETDWELVNAFHDGELSDADTAAFEARLLSEPALSEALQGVTQASLSLKALKPQPGVSPHVSPTQTNGRSWFGGWTGALAAAFALIAFALWSSQTRTPALFDMHQALQDQPFVVAVEDIRNVALASRLGVHDLSGANLVAVSATDIPHGSLAHYAGLNGCRLSYFKVDRAFELPAAPAAQAIAWTTPDGMHHAIVATGMDLAKFEAIATYLQHVSHDLARTQVYASMAQATDDAVPCVG